MRVTRLLATAVVLVLGGCGLVVPIDAEGPEPQVGSGGDVVTRSLRDVERFWKGAYPDIADGRDFQPLQGGFHPYTKSSPPPACGGQESGYQPNAFYCPPDDFIAWDAQTLIPQLREDFGDLLVGVVMAHEYGHAIQTRLGRGDEPTVVLEQQADCYAGAWTADVLAGNSAVFKDVTPAQLDDTVAGLLLLRDQPGTPALAEGAHGNAFDRIRALQDGVEKGPAECAGYKASNLPVTEVPFSTRDEAATGGNLPYGDAINLLARDAQDYWTATLPRLGGETWQPLQVAPFDTGAPPTCQAPDATAGGKAFYCPDRSYVAFDNDRLGEELYQGIGDFAVGMLLGDLFARAAQARRGQSTRDQAGQLAVDCLAGSWTNNLLTRDPDGAPIRLSPGDLDEAVGALLAWGRADDGSGPTAFQRIGAYREGVLEGLSACS
jgi:predicted metalloprotease